MKLSITAARSKRRAARLRPRFNVSMSVSPLPESVTVRAAHADDRVKRVLGSPEPGGVPAWIALDLNMVKAARQTVVFLDQGDMVLIIALTPDAHRFRGKHTI